MGMGWKGNDSQTTWLNSANRKRCAGSKHSTQVWWWTRPSRLSRKNRQAASVRVSGFWKNRDLRNQNPSSTMDGLLKAPHKSWEQLAAKWELVIWFSWKSAGDGWFSLTISYVTLRIGSSSAFLLLALRTGKFRHRINLQKLREQVRKRRVPT